MRPLIHLHEHINGIRVAEAIFAIIEPDNTGAPMLDNFQPGTRPYPQFGKSVDNICIPNDLLDRSSLARHENVDG